MKLSITSATLALAVVGSVTAAPTVATTSALSKREVEDISVAIANIQHFSAKRHTFSQQELAKRENQIVTDVLTAIKNTNLAPGIIQYFIDDPTLSNIAINVVNWAIKNNVIDLDTLLKSLNDSGLAVQVIQDLISDCQFYAMIFSLAAEVIENLFEKISGGSSTKRELDLLSQPQTVSSDIVARGLVPQDLLTSLMESLKSSGLASQVVEALVVDKQFYTFGADLIEKLFDSGAITVTGVVSDLIDSGLIPSLIKAFLNIQTLQTVIQTALKAAFGKCGDTLSTGTLTQTTGGSTPTGGSSTCKRKRRRRAY
ncbi:uncharacterized protein RJT20DRAFT_15378 [Scheffersomyces xylosifermentans]|uniref:uncharacterized protein n=1 Tax=Scheffersomyces xylosifermentans TaxID=1304137 RepID=UPI00315D6A11